MKLDENTRKVVMSHLEQLGHVHAALVGIENAIEEEIRPFVENQVPDAEISELHKSLDRTVGNIGRQSMLIMVCSWLEYTIDLLGEWVIQGYQDELKKEPDSKILPSSGKGGSWLDKRIDTFLRNGITCTEVMDRCVLMAHVLRVRNCIVHAGAQIAKFRHKDDIEASIQWLSRRRAGVPMPLLEESDGVLYLSYYLVAKANAASHIIVSHLYRRAAESAP